MIFSVGDNYGVNGKAAPFSWKSSPSSQTSDTQLELLLSKTGVDLGKKKRKKPKQTQAYMWAVTMPIEIFHPDAWLHST